MKKSSLKGALNMSSLSVPEKINRSRSIVSAIAANPGTFPGPSPTLAQVTTATNDLETAWNEAVNGGKDRTIAMHDRETELMKLLYDLNAYVVSVADGDETIIHLANIDTKKKAVATKIDFLVEQGSDSGTVNVRVKALQNATYTWQYTSDLVGNAWVQAGKNMQSKILIKGLSPGTKYWFRVSIFDKSGEHGFSEAHGLIVI